MKSDFTRHMKRHVVEDAKEEIKETSDRGEQDDLVIEEQDFSFTKYEEAYVENEKSFVEVSHDVEVPLVMLPMSSEDVSHVGVPLVDTYDMSVEKPFVCRVVCKKSFATISEMEEYLKTQTNKNMHNCTQCNESFFHEISPWIERCIDAFVYQLYDGCILFLQQIRPSLTTLKRFGLSWIRVLNWWETMRCIRCNKTQQAT